MNMMMNFINFENLCYLLDCDPTSISTLLTFTVELQKVTAYLLHWYHCCHYSQKDPLIGYNSLLHLLLQISQMCSKSSPLLDHPFITFCNTHTLSLLELSTSLPLSLPTPSVYFYHSYSFPLTSHSFTPIPSPSSITHPQECMLILKALIDYYDHRELLQKERLQIKKRAQTGRSLWEGVCRVVCSINNGWAWDGRGRICILDHLVVRNVTEEYRKAGENVRKWFWGGNRNWWGNGVHYIANYGAFLYANVFNAMRFADFPYFNYDEDEKEDDFGNLKEWDRIIMIDLAVNPTSYHSYILLAYSKAYQFSKKWMTNYLKGTKKVKEEESVYFDQALTWSGAALYIILSKLCHDHNIDLRLISPEWDVAIYDINWIKRWDNLGRWTDSDIKNDLCDIFIIIFQTLYMHLQTYNNESPDFQMSIVKNKLHSLSALVSLSYYLIYSYTSSQDVNSIVRIVEVIVLFIKALDNEKWVKFEILKEKSKARSFTEPQMVLQESAPSKGGLFSNNDELEFVDMLPEKEPDLNQSEILMKLHPNLYIMEKLWKLFDEIKQTPNGLSAVVMLELLTNLRAT